MFRILGIPKPLRADLLIEGEGGKRIAYFDTSYSLDTRVYFLLNIHVRLVLKIFQKYLLTSIKKNSE
jgi:hypothetical protein